MFVKPCAGRAVRDPVDMKLLKESGQNKPDNTYWKKRLLAKDIEPAKPAKAPKKEGNAK